MGRMSCSKPPDSAPISQDGLLQPRDLDASFPQNRRRARNRPEPAQELRDWEKQARAKAQARPYPPGIILEPAGYDEEHWTAPHNDTDLWNLQLADAFGTRSQAVISTFMNQIGALCGNSSWDDAARQWRLDENEFSAILAIVASIRPRNEIEAALAAQMTAIHIMQMKCAANALKYSSDNRSASVAGKLARTFVQQIDALQRLRAPNRTKRQSIKVKKELHQHVHYHNARGDKNPEPQPHGPSTAQLANGPALQGPKSIEPALSGTSRKGKAGL